MHYWAISILLVVLGLKYYTSTKLHTQVHPFEGARENLRLARWTLQTAREKQRNMQSEVDRWKSRVICMQEVIESLRMRLNVQ